MEQTLTKDQLFNPGLTEAAKEYEGMKAYIDTYDEPNSNAFRALDAAMVSSVEKIQYEVRSSLARNNQENYTQGMSM